MEIIMEQNIFEREAITDIQRYLRHLSFHESDIKDVPIDGIWESRTAESVRDFQKKYSLPPTGTVDRATFDKLKEEYDRSVALNSPPATIDLFPRSPMGFELKKDDTGYLVSTVQFLLDQLERVYKFPDIPQSGIYDTVTENAVSDFQRRNLISPTGMVGRETWDALVIQHNLLDKYNE